MVYSDTSFSEQLNQVKEKFQDLSIKLEDVCKNLKDPGSPPPSEIPEEINSAIESFGELESYVTKWAKSVQMPDTEAQELDSIKAITTFSKNIVAHQDHQQQDEKVSRDINRARSIKYAKEDGSVPPLDDFLRKLDKLEKRVSTPPISDEGQKNRTQILEDRHAINYLLRLLEPGDELDLGSRGRALNIIGQEYGDAFMGAASIPGSLVLRKISDKKDSQPPPPDVKEKPEESKPKSADNLPVDGQAEVQQEEIPEEPPAITTQEKPEESKPESADNLPIGRQAPIEVEVKKEKTESKDVPDKDVITDLKQEKNPDLLNEEVLAELGFCFNASETAQSIASSLKSDDYTFERGFPDLFWALIREKRLSLAYWLARYVENKELDLSFTPPSYLIEALIHGLAVQNETDSSAHCLYGIYNEKFESLESKESGYDAGIRFLVMAGALRPSLFAPHTGAHTVLKSSDSLTGLNAFFAIVQAVEKFAEQESSISTDSLTAAQNDQQWKVKLDSLSTDAKNWLRKDKNMRNPQLAQIWQDYLNEGKLVHNLVSPVANNNEQQIEKVSEMIKDYNSDQKIRTRARNDANQTANKAFKNNFHFSTSLLETGIREAIDFASRWVKLHNRRPEQTSDYLTRLIHEL